MGVETKISWCDHTASPWHGCTEVHPGCDNCYAKTMAKRNPATLGVWGPNGTRVRSVSFWNNCRKWNKAAEKAGKRATVFPSICDPFEDWQGPILNASGERLCYHYTRDAYDVFRGDASQADAMRNYATMDDLRRDLFVLIDACPWLDFLLLTKRPQNVRKMWPTCDDGHDGDLAEAIFGPICGGRGKLVRSRNNVWLLTSISDQATADAMLPELLKCRDLVPVLGVSYEPALEPVDFRPKAPDTYAILGKFYSTGKFDPSEMSPAADRVLNCFPKIDWIIVGGESGANHRVCDLRCITDTVAQCKAAGVACYVKQDCGPRSGMQGRIPDDVWSVKEYPRKENP